MSLPEIELLGSGETLNLELILPKTDPRKALKLWESHIPENAKRTGLGFKYFHKMSQAADDQTLVHVEFKTHKDHGTLITLTHSFLIDEEECNEMRSHWMMFISKLGASA